VSPLLGLQFPVGSWESIGACENKAAYKKNGQEVYNHLQGSFKILINSLYGFLSTNGLNFNAPKEAAEITKHGRKIITQAVNWAEFKNFQIAQIDTDGFIFNKANINCENQLLKELNETLPKGIEFESDGYLPKVVMVKAKNYAKVYPDGSVEVKGSAFKSSSKEPALREMCQLILKSLLGLIGKEPNEIYLDYVREANDITDISRWASKKTLTKAVQTSQRTQEKRIRSAIEGQDLQQGDKFYVYFKDDETLQTIDKFNGEYFKKGYLRKVFNAIKPFKTVLDESLFINYTLKRNEHLMTEPNEINETPEIEEIPVEKEFNYSDVTRELEKNIALFKGDSLDVLKEIPDNSIDSIVTDPPYGLGQMSKTSFSKGGFMGKEWDAILPPTEIWKECQRVLKPGGYLVAMSASRTYHRLAVQLEDLGMICHPMIGWIYGSGFPKATDLSKQFDKQVGAEREIIGIKKFERSPCRADGSVGGENPNAVGGIQKNKNKKMEITAPSTDLAKKWEGYKYGLQSLKPALEPIAVFQKPWKSKDVKRMTDNIVKHGVGAFNIDACRVGDEKRKNQPAGSYLHTENVNDGRSLEIIKAYTEKQKTVQATEVQGRHPANLLHDGSEVVEEVFLKQAKPSTGGKPKTTNSGFQNVYVSGKAQGNKKQCEFYGAPESVSRFFNTLPITDLDDPFLYTAKPSKKERGEGNNHPTVKPFKLMEWLIKLVTPKNGRTLDPFMGSGTTGIAAKNNEFKFVGIEREDDFFEIAKKRIDDD